MMKNYLRMIRSSIVILFVTSIFFCGCVTNKPMYKLDYCGQKLAYSNAEDSYEAGSTVTLYYRYVATDTDYSFLLDGKVLDYSYDENNGFEITFIMPDHDAILECVSINSMYPFDYE